MKQGKKEINCIGLMSGTSLDGLDMAYCSFVKPADRWQYTLKNCSNAIYPDKLKSKLTSVMNASAIDLCMLDIELGKFFGKKIKQFIIENDIGHVDFIASHGHTIFHQPDLGITKQIGSGAEIFVQSAIPVICDFRVIDVALGGQGAPLVPIGDAYLFGDYDYCINLGGICNITFNQNPVIAGDITACNIALNHYSQKLGQPYDDKGKIAESGSLNSSLLEKINALHFYKKSFPKSIGREWVYNKIISTIDAHNLSIPDTLHTLCIHISQQIEKLISNKKSKIIITGGGALNIFLLNQIKSQLPNCKINATDTNLINYKEALIFGFLGALKYLGKVNCLSSVTGAQIDNIGGVIYGN